MAGGDGTATVQQLVTLQQKDNVYASKPPLASKRKQDQIEAPEESQHLPQHRRKISTSTAYVEDTNVMVSCHLEP